VQFARFRRALLIPSAGTSQSYERANETNDQNRQNKKTGAGHHDHLSLRTTMADRSSLAKTLRLSKLEEDRDQKRQLLEDLHNKKLVIEAQCRELNVALNDLDQAIDTLELEIAEAHHHQQPNDDGRAGLIAAAAPRMDRPTSKLPSRGDILDDEPLLDDEAAGMIRHDDAALSRTPTNDTVVTAAATSLIRHNNAVSSTVTQQQHKENKRPSGTLDAFLGTSTTAKPVIDSPRIAGAATAATTYNNNSNSATATAATASFRGNHYTDTQRFRGYNDNATTTTTSDPNARFSDNTFPWSQRLQQELARTFHIPAFRANQREIINATLSGVDVFCVMRTYVPCPSSTIKIKSTCKLFTLIHSFCFFCITEAEARVSPTKCRRCWKDMDLTAR
jgi:hypothetical protein